MVSRTKAEKLKIAFFGLGSIGKKHAQILSDNFNHELYAYRTKMGQEHQLKLKIKEYTNIEDLFSLKPNIAFITNPTFLHAETALICANRDMDLFIEKPLSNNLNKLEEIGKEIKKRKLFTYVAYNLRFHPILQDIKRIVSENEKLSYFKVTCRSYLPKWRPNQDYIKSYSAKKEQGGGVLLDLSHEIDYIDWIFGEIKTMKGICDKISDLKISTEDIVKAQIICKKGIKGYLHLDYFSQQEERRIKVYLNDGYIEGDLINNSLKIIYEKGKTEIKNYKINKDQTYKEQLKYFFEQYKKQNYNIMNNFPEALKTFKKIMEFKENYCKI